MVDLQELVSREEARVGLEAKEALLKKIKMSKNIQAIQRVLKNYQKLGKIPRKLEAATNNSSAAAAGVPASALDIISERRLSRLAVLVITVRRTKEGSLNTIKGSHTNIKGSPTNIEGSPTNIEGSTAKIEDSPTNVEGSPTTIQGSPTKIKGSLTKIEGSPTTIQGSPTKIEGSPTNIKGSPTNYLARSLEPLIR